MPLLCHVHNENALERIRSLLEGGGVPLQNFSSRLGRRASYRVAVFVCANSQFQEALLQLKGPRRKVANPIGRRAYDNALENMSVWTVIRNSLIALAVLSTVFLVMMYFRGAW